MNNITNNKRAISVIVILALVLVLVGVVNHNDSKSDKKEAVVASTENTSLYAGMLADMSKNDALTAGIVYEAENSSAATAEDNSDVLVGATLANIDEYPEGTTYGYTNIGFAQVEDGNLNVRKSAAADGAIVGKLTNNNAVEVISTSEDGQWLEITSGNVEGFVKAEYIVTGEEALALVPELIRTYAVVEADVLRVRAEPNTDSKTLETVNDSDGLVATAILDGWIEVEVGLSEDRNALVINLKDGGKPFNPLEQDSPQLDLPLDERRIGGLGVFFYKTIMDSVSYRYESGCNVLSLKKNLK